MSKSTLEICRTVLLLAGLGPVSWSGAATAGEVNVLLQGTFDNREQVSKASPDSGVPPPHVTVVIEPTSQKDWSLWRVHMDVEAENSFDQTWAMRTQVEHDGSKALVPYYQYKPAGPVTAATFDPKTWLSLEACALRGEFGATRIKGMSEGEPCVVVTMSIGPRRALLPVGIDRVGEWLHLDLNYRGARTRIDAHRLSRTNG